MAKVYAVTEVFQTLQGEGMQAGRAAVFCRFSKCNLTCDGRIVDQAYQPLCDTEFESFQQYGLDALVEEIDRVAGPVRFVVMTGGEPALQLDRPLVDALHERGFEVAIETNGTRNIDDLGLDWICVSPKTAEHTLQQVRAHEVKYVRCVGQGIPRTRIQADHYLISPAAGPDGIDRTTLAWCIDLVKQNPQWRMSVQQHKHWRIR